jgi:hemerythrin-like domain-containing protein
MPRHKTLIPFSHDHHEALLVALRLKKGGPSSPHDMLWPKEPKQQWEALVRFFDRGLSHHFELEERLLFPAARNIATAVPLIDILLSEHRLIRDMIEQIVGAEPDMLLQSLKVFGEALERHIRREERELFPLIESAIEARTITLDDSAIMSGIEAYRSK